MTGLLICAAMLIYTGALASGHYEIRQARVLIALSLALIVAALFLAYAARDAA